IPATIPPEMRRSERADAAVDESPVIDETATVTAAEYRALLASVGWQAFPAGDEPLDAALAKTWNLTARTPDGGRLIGLARVLDDGLIYASIWDVIVAPDWRRRGIARTLATRIMDRLRERRLVALVATPAGDALYRSLGFAEASGGSRALFLRSGPAAPLAAPDAPSTPTG
ncbi:MAG TPA: GNAT family N-acetyltransferase, partial [Thermomicrobiales bacterium]|nr:GNAT family N-acetyltransferase [Thermomicrobiales bacterium]